MISHAGWTEGADTTNRWVETGRSTLGLAGKADRLQDLVGLGGGDGL
jgi:hypothetical protein